MSNNLFQLQRTLNEFYYFLQGFEKFIVKNQSYAEKHSHVLQGFWDIEPDALRNAGALDAVEKILFRFRYLFKNLELDND